MALSFVSRANAVPVVLSSPTRYLSATQAHAAGNLLVAVFHMNNGQVVSLSNLAGDSWIKSALSPYLTGTIHHHEVWYVLATKGHPADVLTVFLTGETSLAITVYEFAVSDPVLRQALYVSDAAANIQVDGGMPPTINSGVITIPAPSVLVATYRDQSSALPTSPSCIQFGALNDAGATNIFDGYQVAPVSAAVTAIAGPNNSFPQWSILAAAFTESGFGCPQDLPVAAGSLGVGGGQGLGCAQDLPAVSGGSGVGCTSDLPTG